MRLLTNQGMLMNTPHKQRLKKTWHLFKKGEQKASVYFFWGCVLGLMSLTLNHKLFGNFSAARVVIFMALIGLSGYGAFYIFRQAWHQHQWYRCITPITALVRRINPHKAFVFTALLFAGIFLGQQVFAGEKIKWVNPSQPTGQGMIVSTHFNTTFVQGNPGHAQSQRGYYGFGVGAGYQWALGHQHYLRGEMQFNQHSKSTFTDRSSQQFSTSLTDIDVLLWHQYRITQWLSIGGITGVAFTYGFNDHPNATPHFYRNLLPIVGMGSAIKLTENISITMRYLHHFGRKDIYQSKSALPALDRFSLGVSYVF